MRWRVSTPRLGTSMAFRLMYYRTRISFEITVVCNGGGRRAAQRENSNRAEAGAVAERTAEPPRGDRVTVRVAHKLGSVGDQRSSTV